MRYQRENKWRTGRRVYHRRARLSQNKFSVVLIPNKTMNSWPTIFSSTQPAIQKPPRKVFFSFHYQPDVHRAFVIRNSWVTKEGRAEAGFFDASVFEAKKRESKDSL